MSEKWRQMSKRHREEKRVLIVRHMRNAGGNTKMAAYNMGVESGTLRNWIHVEFGGVNILREGLKI